MIHQQIPNFLPALFEEGLLLMPKVSLITTFLNRERYLPIAIDSILNQTYQDYELILWDDGSVDNSLEIAREYSLKDSRLKVISSPHKGRIPSPIKAIA